MIDPKEKKFLEMMDGTVLRTVLVWPDYILVARDNIILMQYPQQQEKLISVDYRNFGIVFEKKFGMDDQEVQVFLKGMVEKHLGWKETICLSYCTSFINRRL